MCGIAGIVMQQQIELRLNRMLNAISHRGPDDKGIEILQNDKWFCGLGNTRLAILDLSNAGRMPMEDKKTGNWITFNGEIYNYLELRKLLEMRGYQFNTQTDTEVILKGYSEWGIGVVNYLEGMFAFAIWDKSQKALFLARDRLGEKPLYYYSKSGLFVFASEVRAILASELVARKVDPVSIQIFLHNGYCISPRTIIEDIRSLLPGEWMRVSYNGSIIEQNLYWDVPTFRSSKDAFAFENTEHLLEILSLATKKRCRSDVPLGAFLSGGLDSSIIVSLMSRTVGDVRTFSIGFEDKDFDESPYAQWVAKKRQTHHTEIILTLSKFNAWLDAALDAMDQPTFDGLNVYFVSRAARESGLKVALSGLGGDELFGGYPYFKAVPILTKLQGLTQGLNNAIKLIASNIAGLHGWRKGFYIFTNKFNKRDRLLATYQISQSIFPTQFQNRYLGLPAYEENWEGLPREFYEFINKSEQDDDDLSLLSRYVLRIFQGERTLRDSDMMSMASSLELRTVFTDHVFVENIWKIAGKIRCSGAPDKPFESRLFRSLLGDDYPYRRKRGFVFPFQKWLLSASLREKVMERLNNEELLSIVGLNNINPIIMDQRLPWSRIWAIYVLARWIEKNDIHK